MLLQAARQPGKCKLSLHGIKQERTSFGLFAFRICNACSWRGCPLGQPAAQQQHILSQQYTSPTMQITTHHKAGGMGKMRGTQP